MPELIVQDGSEQHHRERLQQLLASTNGPVRIASAYVTDEPLLSGLKKRNVRLLTNFSGEDTPWEIVSNSTKPQTLKSLINAGVECGFLSGDLRLHAKVYIFGDEGAVVTSANLTQSGLESNIEVGVQVTGGAVQHLISWFDELWKKAKEIKPEKLFEWEQKTHALRQQFRELKRKSGGKRERSEELMSHGASPHGLRTAFDQAKQFFLCNTDRGGETPYDSLEKRMHKRRFAAAWEPFSHSKHMDRVRRGDLIFMYANGDGIIAIGRAIADEPEKLQPGEKGRLRKITENWGRTLEWRVPVEWLVWADQDKNARPWKQRYPTFIDVSKDTHQRLREAVKTHFIDS